MRGLIRYLSPFAPDQSGASGVFYDLGGLIVICDAGGCTGNICGFDEPRWFSRRSGIMSAGLRDMDAILGRDDQLVEKLKSAVTRLGSPFAVLIGTPVPAVIGTDFRALGKMAGKRCGIPVLTVSCKGTGLYDEGEEEAYLSLMEAFAGGSGGGDDAGDAAPLKGLVGVIGATPLSTDTAMPPERLSSALGTDRLLCYGAAGGLSAVRRAPRAEKNLVISPSGIRAAEYLRERFGTPYEAAYPLVPRPVIETYPELRGKRVLVVHQQFAANAVREGLAGAGCEDVTCATFFMMKEEYAKPGDARFSTEESFTRFVEGGGFDAVIGDRFLSRAVRGFRGRWIHMPEFAVSGECADVGETGEGPERKSGT